MQFHKKSNMFRFLRIFQNTINSKFYLAPAFLNISSIYNDNMIFIEAIQIK